MPSYPKKDGSKGFHMNPQAAKSLGGVSHKTEDQLEEKVSPGIHDKVAKLANYNGHDFNGHKLAHHVELHHGGSAKGEPPMHEGHTHHTIAHPHPEHGSEPEIKNHESAEDAHGEENDAMHEGCPECDSGGQEDGQMADLIGAGADSGSEAV
jgi:hypothetical protein